MSDVEKGAEITIVSGVSLFTGGPFCAVSIDGRRVGQLTPSEVRAMAMSWLSAAESAEHDAAMVAVLKSMDFDTEHCAAALQLLRAERLRRGESDS